MILMPRWVEKTSFTISLDDVVLTNKNTASQLREVVGVQDRNLGFGDLGLGFLGFRVSGFGFRVWGLRFRVWSSWIRA